MSSTSPGGRQWAHTDVHVAIVAGSVQLAVDGRVVRSTSIHQDRAKELGAFATPHGRPRKITSA